MKLKQKLIYAILGFVVGNVLLLFASFGYNQLFNSSSTANEISFEKTLELIDAGVVEKVHIKPDSVELTNINDTKLRTKIDGSDAPREAILHASEDNNVKEIKIEPASTGWYWISLLNLIPVVFAFALLGLLAGIFVRLGKNRT